MTDAVLVHDDGPTVGFGHRRRMETLARELGRLGVPARVQPLGPDRVAAPIVVVDSYLARADDTTRFTGGRVAAVDDLLRDLAVDLLVDPCPGADASDHPSASHVLAGAKYALLGSDVGDLAPRPIGATCSRVVVTAGGTGISTASTLRDALHAELGSDVEIVVLGPKPDGAPVDGVAQALADADLVVTAGGITMLESIALGRPTVVFLLAENQRRQVEGAATVGAVRVATEPEIPKVVAELASDVALRTQLSTTAAQLIDGLGPARVAEELADGC